MPKETAVLTDVQSARSRFKEHTEAVEAGRHIAVQRRGKPVMVWVPVDWYVAHDGKLPERFGESD
jgi:antitoxin (DNA-binding transcriptional repressor) of toxin-antitoxin stability system